MENLTVAPTASLLSPVTLFLQADLVVRVVMIGLLLASIWTWAIIIGHGLKLRRIRKASDQFDQDFAKAEDIDRFHEAFGKADLPNAKVFAAGIAEWRRSTAGKQVDREGTRARLASAMSSAVASRWRVPSRSIWSPLVERRHSVMPAPSTRTLGRSLVRRDV